ncbi:TDT family transporter [Intestinibacter sp.]
MKNLMTKIEKIPVPILPCIVGLLTLSNVYYSMGFKWIKYLSILFSCIVLTFYIIKMVKNTQKCKDEYNNVVFASLYAGFSMALMIIGSFVFEYNQVIGKLIWLIAVFIHVVHILIFTYRNVLKGVNKETFVPSWFVTYNGLLTSTVVGTAMNQELLCKIIVIYGILVFLAIVPFMIIRVIKTPLEGNVLHTGAIFMAPSSLCLVGYLNFFEPNKIVVYLLYSAVLAALAYIIWNIPNYFSVDFYPGFAGITFPMAIGIVASSKMGGYLTNNGLDSVGEMIIQLQGIQIFLTTIFIGFVVYNFIKSFMESL